MQQQARSWAGPHLYFRQSAAQRQLLGDVTEFGMSLGRDVLEDAERLISGDLVALHEDSFGLTDHVPRGNRGMQLVGLGGMPYREVSVHAEELSDVFGI